MGGLSDPYADFQVIGGTLGLGKAGRLSAGQDWMRPPHIHFEVHGRFERLITQMYFPGEPLNASDRLLHAALRPDLLIAKPVPAEEGCGHRLLNFDIVLSTG
ncbi:MAG TPA: hypothetical protein VLO30_04605 [Chthoniobacterales bacterium]|nr:hypothetical protein [Chthoniobacterales bacterium]